VSVARDRFVSEPLVGGAVGERTDLEKYMTGMHSSIKYLLSQGCFCFHEPRLWQS
jgi:hypothetical protein